MIQQPRAVTGLSFRLSRSLWVHQMHIMYAVAALFVVAGLVGPKWGRLLAVVVLMIGRVGLLLGLALWLVIQVRRRRTPGFTLAQLVADPSRWTDGSSLRRAGYTTLFISSAAMFACLGGLIGTLGVYFVWRIT